MNLLALILKMIADGDFRLIAGNSIAQFGTPARRYLGAEILPERLVNRNIYRETGVKFRTVVANDGTRYSPVQKKDGKLVSSVLVELGNSDIGNDITAEDYDAIIEMLERNEDLDAAAGFVSDWADAVLNLALIEHNERQRWAAIVNGQVVRRGDNGYLETVDYPNFPGQRTNAGGQWSNDNYDPMTSDIVPKVDLLRGKGFVVNRIVTSNTVLTILLRNAKVRAAILGRTDGAGMITRDQLNGYLAAHGIPPIETYDLTFQLQGDETQWFYPRNALTLLCTTGRDARIETEEETIVLSDTHGYLGVGRAAGQSAPGRVLRIEARDDKPPRVDGQAWQTSFPVLLEPDSNATIAAIS